MTKPLPFRRRPQEREAEDRDLLAQQEVGNLCGFTDADGAFLPPLVQTGWMRFGHGAEGDCYCLVCAPGQPTRDHVPVYTPSIFAAARCACCTRPLDHHVA